MNHLFLTLTGTRGDPVYINFAYVMKFWWDPYLNATKLVISGGHSEGQVVQAVQETPDQIKFLLDTLGGK